MVTGPLYDASGGHPTLDFVNSVDRTVGKPWVDRLRSYRDLVTWSEAAGTLPVQPARLTRAATEGASEAGALLEHARAVREAMFRIFSALAARARPAEDDLALLNVELGRALAHARVEPRDEGYAWTWQTDEPDLALPLWPLVRAAAELLTSPERSLVRRCASETCLWLFLDRTKNHARRWCDMKVCGNREKVRRFRGNV